MGKFVIKSRTNGDFQFNLHANNGQIIMTSQGYATKYGCENGIESVRTNSQDSLKFERMVSVNSKYYFNLKAGNGQIIGTSEMYESSSGRDNGIESVQTNAPTATIEDLT